MEEAIDDFIDKFWKNDRIVELRQLAEENGWRFTSRQRFAGQPTALKQFRLFHGKKGKRITGILETRNPELQCDSRIYDYVYYSDGGKRKTTVIELTTSFAVIPFRIKPKAGLSTFFKRLTRKRSALIERFHLNYEIEGADPAAVDMQLPDSALELIAQDRNMTVEGSENVLLFYYYKQRLPVGELLEEYLKALGVLERMINDRERDFV